MEDYELKYKALVKFLKELIDEADELETYDDNMENLYNYLKNAGEVD